MVLGLHYNFGDIDNTFNACSLKTDGTLWTWGYNDHGALGQNNDNTLFITSSNSLALHGYKVLFLSKNSIFGN